MEGQPKEQLKNSTTIQQSRLSDQDKGLIRNTFYEREDLLLLVRNLFFGFELTEGERFIIQSSFSTPESRKVMRKVFLPELGKDIPIGQSVDLWMTIKVESDAKKDKDTIKGRTDFLVMQETALALLENPNGKKVDLTMTIEDTKTATDIIARNTFISHVETQLLALRALANEKVESNEEQLAKKLRDSSK